MDSTTRLALNKPNPDPVTGDYVDISKLNENADKIDGVISATVCTSGTRPGTPFQGQIILETDTGRLYVWSGSIWLGIVQQGGGGRSFLNFVDFERDTAVGGIITGKVTGDTVVRILVYADGKIEFGPGSAGRDTNLYRGGADLLKTDDAFQAVGALNGHLVAVKTAAETVASSNVLQDDDHLFIPVVANATYLMDAFIIYYAALAADIQVGWTAPAGASMEWSGYGPSASHTGTPSFEGDLKFEDRNISQNQAWGGTASIITASPRGCLQTSGTAGTLRFRWAQNASNVDGTIVYSKSWVRLHRVA